MCVSECVCVCVCVLDSFEIHSAILAWQRLQSLSQNHDSPVGRKYKTSDQKLSPSLNLG